ncbi:MAG: hypothetical protein QOK39_99, partial [Acidimicrobiaceae bacterium]|nr:hypothetical protein [Acidimicrobiaceae bacterium]
HAIKSNVKELREMYTREVLHPHGAEFTDEIEAQLIDPHPSWAGAMAGFDDSERLTPDLEAFAIAVKDLRRVYTINELRRMKNLADLPFEWANQPWMEPGSLPAGLAPAGATVNPEEVDPDVDPDAEQGLSGDDETEDEDDETSEAA